MDIRKGPWSLEEDTILINYVATHAHVPWNSVARCAGLKRSGKSCRLRWLNYLRPDIRRGNITLQEQITILDLHCRWGNRWSKIARHLPGRTDNEIKNYWRTRVVKVAKQFKCDVDSEHFKDALRNVFMPRLIERIQPPSETHGPPLLDPCLSACSARVHGSSCDSSELPVCSGSEQLDNDVSGLCLDLDNQILTFDGGDLKESLWNDEIENVWLMHELCDDMEIKDKFLA